jgi:hypothetical protein
MIQFLFFNSANRPVPGNNPGAAKIRYQEKATELNTVAAEYFIPIREELINLGKHLAQ